MCVVRVIVIIITLPLVAVAKKVVAIHTPLAPYPAVPYPSTMGSLVTVQ